MSDTQETLFSEDSMFTDEELAENALPINEDDLFGLNEEATEEGAEEATEAEEETEEEGEAVGEAEPEESDEAEESVEEIEDINWQEINEELKGKNANINIALQAERTKRQERDAKIQELEAAIVSANTDSYKDQLAKVREQLKELDLEDVIKIEEPKELDPRLQALLKGQEATEQQNKRAVQVAEMQTVVTEKLSEYGNIDAESAEQGAILGQMILSSVGSGAEMSVAVDAALTTLNSLLENTTKVAKKAREPAVKPKSKPIKAATTAKKSTNPEKKAIASGDFKDLFAQMGKRMAGDN